MVTFQIQAVTVNEPATGQGVYFKTETLISSLQPPLYDRVVDCSVIKVFHTL
jgi:hypothetical protein